MVKIILAGIIIFGIFLSLIILGCILGGGLGGYDGGILDLLKFIFAISLGVSSIALAPLAEWARKLFVKLMYIVVIYRLWLISNQMSHPNISRGYGGGIVYKLCMFILPIASIYYLTRSKVKEQFK